MGVFALLSRYTGSSGSSDSLGTRGLLRTALLSLLFCLQVSASWNGNDDGSSSDTSIYGNSLSRDWLYSSTGISIQLEGCMWGYVADNEDAGCMESSSEDGTTYWYQMANCRRAQAVFTMYGTESSSSASCNKNNFKESFVTMNGLSEFIEYLAQYDANSPFGDNYAGGEDADYDDDGGGYDDLPICDNKIGLGCADDGTFSLQYFEDTYCLKPSGKTYDKLKSLNRALKTYKSCAGIYSGEDAENEDATLPYYLISTSESCSSLDSGFCVDNSAMKDMRSHTGGSKLNMSRGFGGNKSWVTKLKYATGGLLLLASFVMFTGILFTNRRRRRALLQRKYRQSRSDRSRKNKSSRSKSKSSRSKSRSRSRAKAGDGEGVFA